MDTLGSSRSLSFQGRVGNVALTPARGGTYPGGRGAGGGDLSAPARDRCANDPANGNAGRINNYM
jgi:hypothetical protein